MARGEVIVTFFPSYWELIGVLISEWLTFHLTSQPTKMMGS